MVVVLGDSMELSWNDGLVLSLSCGRVRGTLCVGCCSLAKKSKIFEARKRRAHSKLTSPKLRFSLGVCNLKKVSEEAFFAIQHKSEGCGNG